PRERSAGACTTVLPCVRQNRVVVTPEFLASSLAAVRWSDRTCASLESCKTTVATENRLTGESAT
ncbi:hypothetical protein, partial [Bradyrhizobium ottawaense]|uniref:hypothetical protein n=1 Tax=Bradyrhizobium ottawaense TaxID=931866 RepID=UPI0030C6A3FD